MSTVAEFGQLNGHVIGIVMKEMVRRAISAIRTQRFLFEAEEKSTVGKDRDFVTSADKAAQEVYVRVLRESFPQYGIIAEENELSIPCSCAGAQFHFSVDPLDGTKAFMRRQSHGIGTMLALKRDNEIIAAFVGDVMTQEIFGFRPESRRVFRISEYDKAEELTIDTGKPLAEQYVLLRDSTSVHSAFTKDVVESRLFQNLEVSGGSIGIGLARLWKGEVGGVVLRPSHSTPWDMWPIIGICKKMGFVFLRPSQVNKFQIYQPPISINTVHQDHETFIIHESRLSEFADRGANIVD